MSTHIRNIVFCSIVILSSCTKLIDDSFDSFNPTPVLIGILEADSTISVTVGITANLSDGLPTYVDNALVVITSDTNITDTLSHNSNGKYSSSRTAKVGETYVCTVQINGHTTISAKTTVPMPTKIKSINFSEKASRDEDGEILSSIDFFIDNDTSKKLFWEVEVVSLGQFGASWSSDDFNTTYSHYIQFFAEQNLVLLNEAAPLNLFSNTKIENSNYNVKFFYNKNNLTEFYGKDRVDSTFIVLKTVDQSYYNYVKQYYIYQTGKEIQFGYTAKHFPLYSNVKNGYGIFTSFTSTRQRYMFQTDN